jgi:hypothetical protein
MNVCLLLKLKQKIMIKKILYFVGLGMIVACGNNANTEKAEEVETVAEVVAEPEIVDNQLTEQEKSDGWVLMFDGVSTKGWRGYNREDMPTTWSVVDGILTNISTGGEEGGEGADGGDVIYTEDTFGEFEFYLEWQVSTAGNSGVLYHVVEDTAYTYVFETGPEYQLLDDLGYPDPLDESQKVGSDYAIYAAPSDKIVKPAGEWNSSRIRYTKEKVTYWLNGKITVEFVAGSEDWQKRKDESKWKEYPGYAASEAGYMSLQDHGSPLMYKNIKIRKL